MRRFAALLLAGFAVSSAHAQAPNERNRDQQDQSRGNAQGSTQHKMHHIGVDREAAIGHALAMAIEGSNLWHCAQKAGSQMAKTDRNAQGNGNQNQAMRDPASVLEQHARDSFRASERLFQAVMQDEHATNAQNGAGNAGNNRGQGGEHMAKHQACEEFYRAARDYSRALEASCSNTRQAGAQANSNTGRGGNQASGNQASGNQASSNSASSETCAENGAKVALINHSVKEAVEGVALHQMLRHHGERDRTTQALESHAEQMIASSKLAIDSIDQAGANQGHSSNNAGRRLNGARTNDLETQAANTQGQAGNNRAQASRNQGQAGNNQAQAGGNQGQAGNNQAQNNQGTVRRDAARPNYADERAHSDLKAGESITVHQLAKLGREVIRSVNQLNQGQEQMKK